MRKRECLKEDAGNIGMEMMVSRLEWKTSLGMDD
jgi:hypothetical protein